MKSIGQNEELKTDVVALGEGLSAQQRRFVYEYIIDFNHRRAAKAVGFGANRGIALLRNPLIDSMIQALSDHLCHDNLISRDKFIVELVDYALPVAKGEIPVPYFDKDLGHIEKASMDPQLYSRTMDQIGKHLDFFKGQGTTAGVTVNIDFGAIGINNG